MKFTELVRLLEQHGFRLMKEKAQFDITERFAMTS